jgi:hypothetical protein
MKRGLKIVAQVVCYVAVVATLVTGAYLSTQKSLQYSSNTEIAERDNVTTDLSSAERQTVIKSRQSAVRVFSYDSYYGVIGASSGTYLRHSNGKHYILTTHHGILGECEFVTIIYGKEEYDCLEFAASDEGEDYMIMEVEPIEEAVPVRVPRSLPRPSQWDEQLAVMKQTYYTGFPNNDGPSTFAGNIVRYDPDAELICLDSFAWAGSSGSGVFSVDGKLIGIVMALDIGGSQLGYQVLENFVYVIPAFKIDWNLLEE